MFISPHASPIQPSIEFYSFYLQNVFQIHPSLSVSWVISFIQAMSSPAWALLASQLVSLCLLAPFNPFSMVQPERSLQNIYSMMPHTHTHARMHSCPSFMTFQRLPICTQENSKTPTVTSTERLTWADPGTLPAHLLPSP